MNIDELRNEIDQIDNEFCALFERRMNVAKQIALFKKQNNLPVLDEKREQIVLNRISQKVSPNFSYFVKKLYTCIFELSKEYQNGFVPKKKYALLGRNISYSFSKEIHALFADYEYNLINLEPEEFEPFLNSGELAGCNVTIPYKRNACSLCSELSSQAKRIGGVNTVVVKKDGTLFGDNTDYYGFLYMAKRAKIDFNGKNVLIFGDGATSATVQAVVEDAGGKITVISRRGENNYENVNKFYDTAEILINKLYGEERLRMMSYAASMAEAAQSPLTPLFRQQLLAEGGFMTKVNDLHFLEEGGVIATIHGETVAMGSAYFMRSQKISLPHDLKLQTGVFLAVDGVLCAIFVIKYRPSRNAEWALRALKRNRIRPVLAVRSSNVTPGLIKRKFGVDCRCVYPTVSARLAFSDLAHQKGEKPYAALYRQGMLPLVETVIGARRLCAAVRRGTVLSIIAAALGLFLSYYLTSAGSFTALEPVYMLAFLLVWLLPTLLLSGLVKYF